MDILLNRNPVQQDIHLYSKYEYVTGVRAEHGSQGKVYLGRH